MHFLLWQEVLISRGLSGVLMFFLEACFLVAVLYKAVITSALGQENTDMQVLVILIAEALPGADCKSDLFTGSPGIRNDPPHYQPLF